eukprot:13807291-Ditylum_brightwellii.AAC.2
MPVTIAINCALTGTSKAMDKGWDFPNCYQIQKKLTETGLNNAMQLAKNDPERFHNDGKHCHAEAEHQWTFGREMAKLAKPLPKETYKIKAKGSSPGTHSFFSLVGNLMEKHPDLEQKPDIEQKLENFYHYLQALNHQACDAVATNL